MEALLLQAVTPVREAKEEETNVLRDGETFASTAAPWVGAEKAWRNGIVPPPHEDWIHYRTTLSPEELSSKPALHDEDLTLTDLEIATVLSSLPPPPSKEEVTISNNWGGQLLKYAAVATFTAAAAWVIFSVMQRGESSTNTPVSSKTRELVPATQYLLGENSTSAVDNSASTTSPISSASAALHVPTKARPSVFAKPRTKSRAGLASAVTSKTVSPDEAAMVESSQDLEVAFGLSNPYVEEVPSSENVMLGEKTAPRPTPEVAPKGADSDGLMTTLSRETVKSVMSSIAFEIAKCKGTRTGRLTVELTVSGATGRVTNAETTFGGYQSSPEGYCAARAVKLAKFPKFQDKSLTVKYPFDL